MAEPSHVTSAAFVGASGSGKTTLLERVIARLVAGGVSVAAVKHTHHAVEWDRAGKDSWRLREAGARQIVLATPERLLLQSDLPGNGVPADLVRGARLVLHEGDRRSAIDKVLVGESVAEARLKGTRGAIIATVGAGAGSPGVPWFDRDDVEGICDLLVALLSAAEAVEASFEELLEASVAAHGHLCPGQVLGVRMTIRGLHELGLTAPPPRKRVVAIVETDRCAADAVASVSGCSLGKRSLKLFDYGKMAASFLDLQTGQAVRVTARDDSRDLVSKYAEDVQDAHEAQIAAYRVMPESELLRVQPVQLALSEADMPGSARVRLPCAGCGEHVAGGRHLEVAGRILCRPCAGDAYYTPQA